MKPAELFDSKLEENFANAWGDEARNGWRLVREGEILFRHQKIFVPDFVFVHQSGRRVLMEVVGFWTPEYLEAKLKTLATFSDHRIVLAVADSIDWPKEQNDTLIFRYKTAIKIADVLRVID